MSLIEIMRSSRMRPVAAQHKFLTNYDPNDHRRVYAFVEGEADQAFYRAHLQLFLNSDSEIFIYNCNGKRNVYEAYDAITKRFPMCRKVLFFVDRDVDDITGKSWPFDPRIFVSDSYSVENYLMVPEVLSHYINDYVKMRRVDISLETLPTEFAEQAARFHQLMLPVMAWIVVMRRRGHSVVLNGVDCGELVVVDEKGTRKRPKSKSLEYLSRVTNVSSPVNVWREVRLVRRELVNAGASRYTRGKFVGWWIVRFLMKSVESLNHVAKEDGGNVSPSVNLTERNFVQLLARAIPTPDSLASFLRFHLGANAAVDRTERTRNASGLSRWISKLGL